MDECAAAVVTDPRALENAKKDLADLGNKITYEPDPYKAAAGAHALAVTTDWAEYKTLDYRKIYESMVKPAFVFDGRNCLNHKELFEIGFNVYPIGKVALSHL